MWKKLILLNEIKSGYDNFFDKITLKRPHFHVNIMHSPTNYMSTHISNGNPNVGSSCAFIPTYMYNCMAYQCQVRGYI